MTMNRYEKSPIFHKRISVTLEVLKLIYERETISVAKIAEAIDKSVSYAQQLCLALTQFQVLSSTRGAQGGFSINGKLEDHTMRDVLLAIGCTDDPVEVAQKFYTWSVDKTEDLTLEVLINGHHKE